MPPAGPEPQSPHPVAARSTSAADEGAQELPLGSRSALAFSQPANTTRTTAVAAELGVIAQGDHTW